MLMRLEWNQWVLNVLTEMIVQVVLCNNIGKTFRMMCHPCHIVRQHSDAAYMRRITGGIDGNYLFYSTTK